MHNRSMFLGHFETAESQRKLIEISDISYDIFVRFLQFLYSDTLGTSPSALSVDDLVSLLKAADKYDVPRLVEMCEVELVRHVTVQNVLEIFQISDILQANQLRDYTMFVIQAEHKLLAMTGTHRVAPVHSPPPCLPYFLYLLSFLLLPVVTNRVDTLGQLLSLPPDLR